MFYGWRWDKGDANVRMWLEGVGNGLVEGARHKTARSERRLRGEMET